MHSPRLLVAAVAAALVALVGALVLRVGPAGAATANFTVVDDWGSGYQGQFTVSNDTSAATTSWRVEFDLPAGTTVSQSWNVQQAVSGVITPSLI